jgi:hypothetical protein
MRGMAQNSCVSDGYQASRSESMFQKIQVERTPLKTQDVQFLFPCKTWLHFASKIRPMVRTGDIGNTLTPGLSDFTSCTRILGLLLSRSPRFLPDNPGTARLPAQCDAAPRAIAAGLIRTCERPNRKSKLKNCVLFFL